MTTSTFEIVITYENRLVKKYAYVSEDNARVAYVDLRALYPECDVIATRVTRTIVNL